MSTTTEDPQARATDAERDVVQAEADIASGKRSISEPPSRQPGAAPPLRFTLLTHVIAVRYLPIRPAGAGGTRSASTSTAAAST